MKEENTNHQVKFLNYPKSLNPDRLITTTQSCVLELSTTSTHYEYIVTHVTSKYASRLLQLAEVDAIQRVLAAEHPGVEGQRGEEHVGHELGVDLPVLAVLLRAARLITDLAMVNHAREEGRVEERQRRGEAAGKAPGGRHDDVPGVLQLAGECVPAAHEQVALGSLDVLHGLGEDGPGDLGKGPGATHAHLAHGLLRVGGVEDVVACVDVCRGARR